MLRLLRWRPEAPDKANATTRSNGTATWVELQLKVMGGFSDTAPYDCSKSEAIVRQTIQSMINRGLKERKGLFF